MSSLKHKPLIQRNIKHNKCRQAHKQRERADASHKINKTRLHKFAFVVVPTHNVDLQNKRQRRAARFVALLRLVENMFGWRLMAALVVGENALARRELSKRRRVEHEESCGSTAASREVQSARRPAVVLVAAAPRNLCKHFAREFTPY